MGDMISFEVKVKNNINDLYDRIEKLEVCCLVLCVTMVISNISLYLLLKN